MTDNLIDAYPQTESLESFQVSNRNECKNPGHQDFSAGKGACQEPGILSSCSKTHMVERENWFPQIALCPAHSHRGMHA